MRWNHRRSRSLIHRWLVAGASVAGVCMAANGSPLWAQASDAAYQDQVKPIFDKSCNGCHTLGGHSGGLKMDSYALLMQGGDDGPVVQPGSARTSMLSMALHYKDPGLQMPPSGKLSDADIATVDKWIEQSAKPVEASTTAIAAAAPPAAAPAPVAAASAVSASLSAAPVSAAASPAVVPAAFKSAASPQLIAEQEQFFETSVRPVLVNKCYFCHDSTAKGGLRLDSREAVMRGGKDGAVVVPGHPEESLLTTAIHYGDSRLQMPPRGALKTAEIAALDQWIKDGLPWPQATNSIATHKVTAKQRDFWAYKPVVKPAVPATTSAWARNDIDRFVLADLEQKHLKPVADADKRTLIRRVTYDLTGLPPTPADVKAFVADKSPDAYPRLVDRLLASNAYGERWGRIWLDVVRYADTAGGGGDFPIPQAYKYRDYVIQSFNQDKPYDRFIREQIAGDLLPSKSEPEHWQAVIATGYLAEASRNDKAYIADAVDNLGYAFLGTTVACARCHDHKFDPIPTADYYAIAGILQSTHFPDPGDDNPRMQVGFVLRDPKAADNEDYRAFLAQMKPIQGAIDAVTRLPGTYDDILPQLEARRMNLLAHAPPMPEDAYAVSEGTPHQAQIQVHGDPTKLEDEVPRGFLQVLGGSALPAGTKGSGRLELADWIASKDNPLTARVIVNRIWLGHFGRGIVATPNNFGTRGVAPSNQPLLDYLASTFVESGWSIKAMQREILLSHAYQLSTEDSAANQEIDPDNAYIWRHTQMRLDAEEVRDSMLADSHLLDPTPSGPHPFPPMSTWNWEEQNPFAPDVAKYENDHRTVYMMVQRSVRHPYLTLFDGADANASTDQRSSSLTPLQALYFLNGSFPASCANHLAEQLDQGKPTAQAAIDQAFWNIYGRPPAKAEEQQAAGFLQRVAGVYIKRGDTPEQAKSKALSNMLQAMFASNEFMFVE